MVDGQVLEDFKVLSISLKKARFGGDHDLCHDGHAVIGCVMDQKVERALE